MSERRKKTWVEVAVPALIGVLTVLIALIGTGMISALNSLTSEVRNLSGEVSAVKTNQTDAARRQSFNEDNILRLQSSVDKLNHDVEALQLQRRGK